MSELIRVEVQRSKWLRGDPQRGCLRDENGLQCCLGFVAVQAGFDSIDGYAEISGLCDDKEVHDPPALFRALVHVTRGEDEDGDEYWDVNGGSVETELILINDSSEIDDATREKRLAEAAVKAGIEFVFVD
jgi:hypothetical protein